MPTFSIPWPSKTYQIGIFGKPIYQLATLDQNMYHPLWCDRTCGSWDRIPSRPMVHLTAPMAIQQTGAYVHIGNNKLLCFGHYKGAIKCHKRVIFHFLKYVVTYVHTCRVTRWVCKKSSKMQPKTYFAKNNT
jgi:hypothetical protein